MNAANKTKANERMGPPTERRISDAVYMALLVCDSGTGRTGKVDHLKAFEADFGTPFAEIGAGIVERVAKFDEHVQRHEQPLHILTARIVNECFNGHYAPPGGNAS